MAASLSVEVRVNTSVLDSQLSHLRHIEQAHFPGGFPANCTAALTALLSAGTSSQHDRGIIITPSFGGRAFDDFRLAMVQLNGRSLPWA